MSNDARIYARAEEAYQASLRQRQANAQKRAEELSEECPRIGEILAEMQLSWLSVVRNAMGSTPEEAQAQVEKIAEKNLALQEERKELLAERGLPADYLYAGPYCEICGDTGFADGKMCACFRPFYVRELKRELERTTGTKGTGFAEFNERLFHMAGGASPEIQESYRKLPEQCRQYAAGMQKGAKSLLIQGDSGRGKTTLALCMAREAIQRAITTLYVTAPTLFSLREEERFRRDEEAGQELARYHACDFLILDDLGLEAPSQNNTATLLTILNERAAKNLPTVVCTALDEVELTRRYSSAVASRLCYDFDPIQLKGVDIRKLFHPLGR